MAYSLAIKKNDLLIKGMDESQKLSAKWKLLPQTATQSMAPFVWNSGKVPRQLGSCQGQGAAGGDWQ